jgi:hypothetical protein
MIQGDDIGMTQQSDGPEIQGLTQNHACLSTRHVYIAALLLKPDNSRLNVPDCHYTKRRKRT